MKLSDLIFKLEKELIKNGDVKPALMQGIGCGNTGDPGAEDGNMRHGFLRQLRRLRAHAPAVSEPERFTRSFGLAPSADRLVTLRRVAPQPVLLPESDRGGCSFGDGRDRSLPVGVFLRRH